MPLPSPLFRSVAGLLALMLLGGVSPGHAGTNSYSAELSLPTATASHSTPISGHATLISTLQGDILVVAGNNGLPIINETISPGLFGGVNDLIFKTTKSGATRAKATVDLVNTSDTSLRGVTATVYLSDDNKLSADDAKIVTLNLSDYVAKGKVAKYGTFNLPFNYKVPSLVAAYLNGKYLIVVLSAENLGSLPTTPVVVGPIKLP